MCQDYHEYEIISYRNFAHCSGSFSLEFGLKLGLYLSRHFQYVSRAVQHFVRSSLSGNDIFHCGKLKNWMKSANVYVLRSDTMVGIVLKLSVGGTRESVLVSV